MTEDPLSLEAMLRLAPVVPVLVIEEPRHAVPLARALAAGGLPMLEVTLRTPSALDCIRRIALEVEEAVIGAGTVLTPQDAEAAAKAGARFAVSPGFTPALGEGCPIPLLPGVATAGEVMAVMGTGRTLMKLFPAEAVGGAALLKALHGPLPTARFCPTGGITPQNAPTYLALPNVCCVGGSWVAPPRLLAAEDWTAITMLAEKARSLSPTSL